MTSHKENNSLFVIRHLSLRTGGFTLTEVIVYIGLLGGIAVFVGNFLIHTTSVYHRARAEREVLSNGRLLLETVQETITRARRVYVPTSRFNTNAGQLSLLIAANSTPDHDTLYQDFWIDNGRMWMRQEGGVSSPLSASSVRVTRFYLERIVQGLGKEAVKITLQVDSGARFPSSITLNATAALRGNY